MRIDAHQHFWQLAVRGGGWPPPSLAAIYRDFAPADLAPLLAEHGVAGTVLVQSLAVRRRYAGWLLALAEQHSFIRAVVGWTDLLAPGRAVGDCAPGVEHEAEGSAARCCRISMTSSGSPIRRWRRP